MSKQALPENVGHMHALHESNRVAQRARGFWRLSEIHAGSSFEVAYLGCMLTLAGSRHRGVSLLLMEVA